MINLLHFTVKDEDLIDYALNDLNDALQNGYITTVDSGKTFQLTAKGVMKAVIAVFQAGMERTDSEYRDFNAEEKKKLLVCVAHLQKALHEEEEKES